MFATCASLAPNVVAPVDAQETIISSPKIFTRGADGQLAVLEDDVLYQFELDLRRRLIGRNAPEEVIALASSSPLMLASLQQQPEEFLAILIYGKQAEIRWLDDSDTEHYYYRPLSVVEIAAIRQFISRNKIIDLPNLESSRIVGGKEETVIGGKAHVFLRLNAYQGRRIYVNNPPIEGESDHPPDDRIWVYTKLISFLSKYKNVGDFERRRRRIGDVINGREE